MEPDAAYWIERLKLAPHPEGGYFAETYRSAESIPARVLPARYAGPRVFATAIYYLLAGDDFSAFHRQKSDEVWHFYAGAGLTLYAIDEGGQLSTHHLGQSRAGRLTPQAIVPGWTWLAARPVDQASYALVGCTVAPGFEFADFELGDRASLVRQFPVHRELIESLTRIAVLP